MKLTPTRQQQIELCKAGRITYDQHHARWYYEGRLMVGRSGPPEATGGRARGLRELHGAGLINPRPYDPDTWPQPETEPATPALVRLDLPSRPLSYELEYWTGGRDGTGLVPNDASVVYFLFGLDPDTPPPPCPTGLACPLPHRGGTLLYVGKAVRNFRGRAESHTSSPREAKPWTRYLVRRCRNRNEAALLEGVEITYHQPPLNRAAGWHGESAVVHPE